MNRSAHPRPAQARYAKGGKLTLWEHERVPPPALALGSGREPIVPLVSSSVPGPLELVHLPRMWLEGILAATGRLHPAFAAGRPLFDEIVCTGIALDRGAFAAFLRTPPLPDELACERWVRAHACRLDAAAIALVNGAILRVQDEGMALVLHDDLRAWDAVHAQVVANRGRPVEPLVPVLSSRTAGGLGVDHLPRAWLKNVLRAGGALPIGYRAGPQRVVARGLAVVPAGVDADTYRNIGLDMPAAVAFIDANVPDYRTFERWVRDNARTLDPGSIACHNAMRVDTRAAKAAAEKAYAGWDDPTLWGYVIDDLIDWRLLFDVVTGAPIPSWSGPA